MTLQPAQTHSQALHGHENAQRSLQKNAKKRERGLLCRLKMDMKMQVVV